MSKSVSVKSSIISSEEGKKSGILGNLISWNIFYKLCNQLSYQKLWGLLRLYDMIAFIELSVDPDYSWGPITKQVLKFIYYPVRGYYISVGESMTTFIILQCVIFAVLFLTFLLLYLILRNENAKGRSLIFLQIVLMVVTQIFPIQLASIIIEPWKCNLITGMMIKFPDQQCFGVPNIIFFVLSFISFSILFIETFIRYFL